jgi:PIN domain nuclease of toxin-antitoxin system
VGAADELAVASITWLELAWLAEHRRIDVTGPIRVWLQGLAAQVRTVSITPGIAATAAELSSPFPGDPMDRIIFATALENGWALVTRDESMRRHPFPRPVTIW